MLSNDPQLRSFQALREAYLPELSLWLSEYPFVERPLYTRISDAIAEERTEQPKKSRAFAERTQTYDK